MNHLCYSLTYSIHGKLCTVLFPLPRKTRPLQPMKSVCRTASHSVSMSRCGSVRSSAESRRCRRKSACWPACPKILSCAKSRPSQNFRLRNEAAGSRVRTAVRFPKCERPSGRFACMPLKVAPICGTQFRSGGGLPASEQKQTRLVHLPRDCAAKPGTAGDAAACRFTLPLVST